MSIFANFKFRVVASLATLALLLPSFPSSAQEYPPSPPRSKVKPVHGQRRKRERIVGVGPVFLEPGFPVPQPRYFSRSSYTVVDVAEHQLAVANFITSKPAASPFIAQAEEAFRSRSYDAALRWIQHALIEDPQNGLLELFAAQALFALRDYNGAADAIARAFSRLPQQQWNTVVANHQVWYRNGEYIMQMRQLEEFITQHPENLQAQFVRGYHHAFLGEREAAMTDMRRVLAIDPDHHEAADLWGYLNKRAPAVNVGSIDPAMAPEPAIELLPPPER